MVSFSRWKPHSQLLQALLQELAGQGVQLRLHQPAIEVHHVNLQPTVHQPAGRLQAQQPPADDGRLAGALCVLDDGSAVIQRAEHEGALLEIALVVIEPFHGRNERAAAGGDHQFVVGHQQSAGAVCHPALAVYADGADAGMEGHVVLGVPLQRIDEDVARVVGARQHAGEQDTVVVAAGLLTDDRDVVGVLPSEVHHFLDESGAGHSVSDHHQFLLFCGIHHG